MANNSVRYPPELRERAVRMVLEATREGVYSSEWAAICAVAQMLGPTPETVRKWVRRAQAAVSGPSADHRRRVVELERENRELRRANEILKAASAFSRGSSTRDLESSGFHRPVSGQVRGRADLPGVARTQRRDRPVHLLRLQVPPTVGQDATRRVADRTDPPGTPGQLWGVRRFEGVGTAQPARNTSSPVHSAAFDAKRRSTWCYSRSVQDPHHPNWRGHRLSG